MKDPALWCLSLIKSWLNQFSDALAKHTLQHEWRVACYSFCSQVSGSYFAFSIIISYWKLYCFGAEWIFHLLLGSLFFKYVMPYVLHLFLPPNKHYQTEILTEDFISLVVPVYKCTPRTPVQLYASSVQGGTAVLSRVLVWSKGLLKDTSGWRVAWNRDSIPKQSNARSFSHDGQCWTSTLVHTQSAGGEFLKI